MITSPFLALVGALVVAVVLVAVEIRRAEARSRSAVGNYDEIRRATQRHNEEWIRRTVQDEVQRLVGAPPEASEADTNADSAPREANSRLLTALDGVYEYRCDVEKDSPALFEEQGCSIGGVLQISFVLWAPNSLLVSSAEAHRLWSLAANGEVRGVVEDQLGGPPDWQDDRGVFVTDNAIWLSYVGDSGRITGSFRCPLRHSEEKVHIAPGLFFHRLADGLLVKGNIRLKKLEPGSSLTMAPERVDASRMPHALRA